MSDAPFVINGKFEELHAFQLLQKLPQGILVADQATSTFVFANEQMQQWLGYSTAELMGKTPAYIHPPEEMERVMMAFQAMLKGEMQLVKNIRFLNSQGAIIFCDVQAQLMETSSGNFICGFITLSLQKESQAQSADEWLVLRQQLNAAQEVGNMGFWTLFHTNQLLEWSDNAFRIFGFEPQSFLPSLTSFLNEVHPEDRDRVAAAFAQHLKEKTPYDIIHRVYAKDDELKYLRERCVTSFDADGEPIYSFGTVVDVTSVEVARLEAIHHLQRLEEILENSRSFTWEVTATGIICNISRSAEKLLGYQPKELLGQPLYFLLHEAHVALEEMQKAVTNSTKEMVIDEYVPVKTKNGELVWLSVSAKMKYGESGKYDGFIGSAIDITSRKITEERLSASESRFRSIAETMPGAVWIADADFKMNYVSSGIMALMGIEPEEFLQQKRHQRYQGESLKKVEAYIKKQKEALQKSAHALPQTEWLEVETLCKDGSTKWVRIATTPLRLASENVIGFLGVISDISPLKEREELLERLNEVLLQGGRLARLGTWELDLKTNVLNWGQITRELHEVDPDFVPDLSNALGFYLPEYRDLLEKKVAEIVAHGGSYDLELQIRTAKNNVRWVRTMGQAQIKNGICERLWGVFQDIDEAKRKSIELMQERSRLDNVIEATKVATWYWNVQTGETIFNERWAAMLGRKLRDFEPTTIQTWEQLCHPDDLLLAREKLDAYFSGKSALYETEFRMQHKEGHWVWIRDVGSVIEWTTDGKPMAMYGTHEDISEAVKTRSDLLHAEEKYRIIAENNFNWEFWQGNDGNYLYHSPSVERITGYTVAELTANERVIALIHPDDRAFFLSHHVETTCGKHAGEMNFRIIDKNGEIHYIDHVCQPIYGKNGAPLGIRGTNIDVTDKQWALNQIRKLLQAVEQSQASIVITNLAGDIEYVNPFFCKMTGYTKEEAKGKNPRILSTGHTSKAAYAKMFEKLQKGETWQGEFLNRKKNGELYWEFATISPIKNEQGEIENYVAIKEDITERKKLSESLKSSELKYRLIAENTSDVIWVYNFSRQRFTYVSPSVQQLRGFSVSEAIQQPIESTMGEEAREKYARALSQTIRAFMEGSIQEIPSMVVEIRQPHKDGHWVWVEVSLQFKKNEEGEVEAIGVSRDIQERKKAEALREKMQAELAKSEARFRTLFYGNASAMYLVDIETARFVDANNAALRFYNYSREAFLQKKMTDIATDAGFWTQKLQHLQKNAVGRFEFKHRRADGQVVDVELFSCLIEINGQLLVHDIVHDISDRNAYLKEIERQNDLLKSIAWTQSHVVRAPVARIMGLVELLDSEKASIFSEPLLLQSLMESAKELDALIHQITQQTLEIKPLT